MISAAIYYHPEAYTTGGPKLMGRNAAGESFLRGYLLHSKTSEFWVQVQRHDHAEHFSRVAQSLGRAEPVKSVQHQSLAALAQPGVVYYPGPGIGDHAYHRAAHGHGAWSLCGITHTTSSATAMDAIADLLTAPVQPWDSVICTSTAVKQNVERLLQAQVDYLKSRLGVSRLVLPQLPVIPLGIHTQDFSFTRDQKARSRAALGAEEGDIVVLFMGRLSFHAKAHPLAMYQALEAAMQASRKRIVLVECGWHANTFIENAYVQAARQACPSVRVVMLDGRKSECREIAWAGADVFCSLSDNIQETFGIVPIEAMAAGLPVVVSDWDGYRDTVRDGVDGFRVPTLMPGPGLGGDLALRHALEIDTYDMYCGHTCSLVAVDIPATTAALTRLLESPDLRRRMGDAGRSRAQQVYDWRVVIGQYETLWDQLAELRRSKSGEVSMSPHAWPARLDPFFGFAGYTTQTLSANTVFTLADADLQTALARVASCRELAMVNFAKYVLPSSAEIERVLAEIAHGPCTAEQSVAHIESQRRPFVFRALVWLVKLGALRVMT